MKLGLALARRVPPASPGPVVLLFKGPTQGYRDYVALMWDRKHCGSIGTFECEADRLRNGACTTARKLLHCRPRETVVRGIFAFNWTPASQIYIRSPTRVWRQQKRSGARRLDAATAQASARQAQRLHLFLRRADAVR